jgi:hypothetical protein
MNQVQIAAAATAGAVAAAAGNAAPTDVKVTAQQAATAIAPGGEDVNQALTAAQTLTAKQLGKLMVPS